MPSDLSLLLLLLLVANSNCKPLDDSSSVNPNEINFGSHNDGDKKNQKDEIDATESWDIPRPFASSSNDGGKTFGEKIQLPTVTPSPILSAEITETAAGEIGSGKSTAISPSGNSTTDNNLATRQQERIGQLKDTFTNIASIFPNQQDGATKQFGNIAGLANLIGLNDSGFYTDRLDPVGFFGGNGWFANKGGILGGPGAFISTGSLFTDYPTPYKK
ncbi:uncharacterized protein LOC125500056 isoform X2 [Athalia rosae]|uniref:uncharacterized protein LOC125500056 isoform X2 n=1 Tax=Athalia rosae TaxID=37344 RepID=UPI0020348C29|nr:uncharacterized protein LOC125500056 isoform X2 [Athalia rosae]